LYKTINGRWLPTDKTGEPNTGWRARVIYETNMKTAYAAGRYGQLQRMKKLFPFWRYRIGNSKKHRPEHEAWNGLVLSADDPWWDTHYPPNGWGCNCYVQALDEVDLRELGKKGPDPAPEGGSRRVQYGNRLIDVPDGIDAGWAYAPGREGHQAQMNALAKADPHVAAQAQEEIEKHLEESKKERLAKIMAETMPEPDAQPGPSDASGKPKQQPDPQERPKHVARFYEVKDEVLEKVKSLPVPQIPTEMGDLYGMTKTEYSKYPGSTLDKTRKDYEEIFGQCLRVTNAQGSVPISIGINEDWIKKWLDKGELNALEAMDTYHYYEHMTAEQRIKLLLCHEIAHSMQTDALTKEYTVTGGHTRQHEDLMNKLVSMVCPEILNIKRVYRFKLRRGAK
jgi:hypothetical protein